MPKSTLIILAGGKGARFHPLTITTPKPLIKIAGKSSLEWDLDSALPFVNEIVIVVGYLDKKIIESFGNSYKGIPLKYVVQDEQLGTGHALTLAETAVTNEDIFIAYGDDLYDPDLFLKIKDKKYATIGKKEANWQNFGVFHLKDGKYLSEIIEKPKEFVGDLVNIGLYKLSKDIFSYFEKIGKSIRGEYEFTDMVTLYAKDHLVEVVDCLGGWIPLSYPWNILDAVKQKLSKMDTQIGGLIEEGVNIKGNIILGKNSVIKRGVSLEGNFLIGEDCVIEKGCELKDFAVLGDNCILGEKTKITRVSMGCKITIGSNANICDSLIADNVTIGDGSVFKNSMEDGSRVLVDINGKIADTGRENFGAIIGDSAVVKPQTIIAAGARMW